jgi:hypothetical protein
MANVKFKLVLIVFFLCLPFVAMAQLGNCTPGNPSTTLCNALQLNSIEQVIQITITYAGTIIGILALIMVVFSGFSMIIARGEPDKLKTAKSGFVWAVGGFIVSICAFVILAGYRSFIGINAGYQWTDTINPAAGPLMASDLRTLLLGVLSRSIVIIGAVALLFFVYSAFNYIISAGNEEKIKKARSGMTWSVVGFVTTLLAYVILAVIQNLLG